MRPVCLDTTEPKSRIVALVLGEAVRLFVDLMDWLQGGDQQLLGRSKKLDKGRSVRSCVSRGRLDRLGGLFSHGDDGRQRLGPIEWGHVVRVGVTKLDCPRR